MRAIIVIQDCEPILETNQINILTCVSTVQEAGDTIIPTKNQIGILVNGTETVAQLNTAVENGVIAAMAELGITLTAAKIRQTKFA